MAHQHELTNWILKNSGSLDLRVAELTWIRALHPGMVDLRAAVTLDGKEFEGRGSDTNEDRALGKAVCEAIERFVCHSHAIASIGVAGHFDESLAKKNARLELIERASLFHHVDSSVPMGEIQTRELKIVIEGRQATVSLRFLEMATLPGIAAVLCLAEGVTTGAAIGGILGLGCAESQVEAIAKAEIECLRNVAALADIPMFPLSKDIFSKIGKPSSEDRRRLLFDFDYCSNLLESLLGRVKDSIATKMPALQPTWINLDLPKAVPANCPLQFFRCMDQSTQKPLYLEFVG